MLRELKVLIVDDERLERVLIRKGFDWESKGFQIVGECASGQEALEFVKYQKPDIVLTDINMPNMNGLELSEKILEVHPKCRIVIITGYRDFEYARTAVRLGVEDFLLKPVSMLDIDTVTKRLKEQVLKENIEAQEVLSLKESILADQDILIESFFQRLVEDRISEKEAVQKLITYGYQCLVDSCVCINIRIKNMKMESESRREIIRLIKAKKYENIICFVHYIHNVVIFVVGKDLPYANEMATTLFQDLKQQKISDITVGISRYHQELKGIAKAFKEAESASELGLLLEKEQCVSYEEYLEEMQKRDISQYNSDEFILAVTNGLEDKVEEYIEKVALMLEDSKAEKVEHIQFLALDMIAKAGVTLNKYGVSTVQILGEDKFYEQIRQLTTAEQFRQFLRNSLHQIMQYHKSKKKKQKNKMILLALEYIEKNLYNPELSLKITAAAVFANESYLSRMFKKVTGKSMIEYISQRRIEESIELLNNTDDKVYEIAERIGFRDAHYFSICFKKHVGITIKEFRQRP